MVKLKAVSLDDFSVHEMQLNPVIDEHAILNAAIGAPFCVLIAGLMSGLLVGFSSID